MQKETVLAGITGVAVGAGVGAAVMFILDPDRGRRRRANVKNRITSTAHEAADSLKAVGADVRNRSQGVVHELARKLKSDEEVDDATLSARVRSELGHVASDPSSIVVDAQAGRVSLGGPVPTEEADEVLATASSVPGVKAVRNLLHVRDVDAVTN